VDHPAQHAGDFDAQLHPLLLLVDPAEEIHVGRRAVRIVPLEGGELGRLVLRDAAGAGVAGQELQQRSDHRHRQGDPDRGLAKIKVFLAQQIKGGDTEDEKGSGLPGPGEGMAEAVQGGGIKDHLPEIDDLGAQGVAKADDVVAGRGLLPGVGDDDPDCTEMGPQRNHAGGEEMGPGFDPVPAEEENGQKARFEKKGKDPLRGESAAEDVPDVAGVDRPVGAELELHDDAGSDAEGEDEPEDARPEFRHLQVELVFGFEIARLHDDQQHAEADAQRRKDVVKGDREGELQSRQQEYIHGITLVLG